MKRLSPCLLSLLAAAGPAAAQVEEIIITGARDTSTVRTEDTLVAPPDTASLLRRMPGANVNSNGQLTGLAQYRGMYGDRVNVAVNGARISSGGPNAMDAPLHYAPVALLESLTIHRGIAPVSSGQETIGGHMEAETFKGDFAAGAAWEVHSRLYGGAQSVNDGAVGSALLTLANDTHLLRASVMREEAGDSEFAGGTLLPSEYARERFDLGYSLRRGDHAFSIDLGRNNTGDAGTAALPMDILSVDSDLLHTRYRWEGSGLSLSAEASMNDLEHGMTNFHLRRPPQGNAMMPGPMLHRRADAASASRGFSLELEAQAGAGLWRAGLDGHYAEHDTAISNPNAAAFAITNFNGVRRDITGIYLEREMALSDGLGLQAGVRYNHVRMDAAPVSANLNPMGLSTGMPVMMNAMAGMLAQRFNTARRSRQDDNLDWFARLNLEAGSGLIWYLGAARKTRAPSYQERYLWLPLESTGGLADGLTYVGNPALDPEVAHEIELGLDWAAGALTLYPRLFYKTVDNYIQGSPAMDMTVNNFAAMMANMGMGAAGPLRFANVEARLYGLDLESAYALNQRLQLRAVLSAVRGERRDIDDQLYRIAPDNLLLALDYRGNGWDASLEGLIYAAQDRVSATNRERNTPGYGILNASTRLYPAQGLEIGLGVNNLFDRHYLDHLGGYNRAVNPDIPVRDRLPGLGRNLYARLIWRW